MFGCLCRNKEKSMWLAYKQFHLFGATWSVWDAIVTSGRPPTPLDAGRSGQPLKNKVLEESGRIWRRRIIENITKGIKFEPKGYRKGLKVRHRATKTHQIIRIETKHKQERQIVRPTKLIWGPILAPTGFRSSDPLGVSFSMYLALPQ